MNLRNLYLLVVFCTLSFSAIDLMSIQANVYQNGLPLDSGNISVYVYNASSGGSLIWNQTYNNIIVNGTYDIQLGSNNTNNMTLTYGQFYYLELTINGVDQNFSGNDRQLFQSAVGTINSTKIAAGAINTTHISDGNITSDKLGSGSVTAAKIALGVINSTHLVNNLSLAWGNLTGFPTACDSGKFINTLGIAPVCSAPTESDPLWAANYSLFNSSWSSTYNSSYLTTESDPLWSGNYSAFNSSWSTTYNSTYDAKAGTGSANCSAGQVAQNVTTSTSGVTTQCFTLPTPEAPNVSQATGILDYAHGGTSFTSYSSGDLLYANASNILDRLAISNNAVLMADGNLPMWGMITTPYLMNPLNLGFGNLTSFPTPCSAGQYMTSFNGTNLNCSTFSPPGSGQTNVSNVTGTLSVENGGTGSNLSGISNGDLIRANGSSTFAWITVAGQDGKVLTVSAGAPTWQNTNVSYVTGVLNATQGGTGQMNYTTGDILYASSTTALSKLPISAGVLIGTGATPAWGTVTTAMVSSAIWNTGLRMNNLSTSDFDVNSNSGAFIVGVNSATSCETGACPAHGLVCTTAYNLTGGTVACTSTGAGAKYCWCH